jgi:hypothetical protein
MPISCLLSKTEAQFTNDTTLPTMHVSKTIVEVSQSNGLIQVILPLVAIAISISTAVLTFFQWYLEGRRVVVDSQSAMLVARPPTRRSGLMLSVTNYGRIPAVVRQWGFDNPREVYSAIPVAGQWSVGPETPYTLEPGTSQTWWLDYHQHKQRLESEHPGGPYLLRGFAVLGTRKHKYSRSFINLDSGIKIPVNPIKRRIASIRSRRGIGILIAGKIGTDQFVMSLQRTGIVPIFKKIRIDVVQDPHESQPAQALTGSLIERRF